MMQNTAMGGKAALVMVLTLLGVSRDWCAQAADAPPAERFSSNSAKGWQLGEAVQHDGNRAYGAVLQSLESFSSASGPSNGALIVTCSKGELIAMIHWPASMVLTVTQPQQMQWRFDNGPPQSESWMSVPSTGASITPSPRDFLAGMRRAHHLTIGTNKNEGGGQIALTFDLDGGQSAANRVINARQVADRAITGCP